MALLFTSGVGVESALLMLRRKEMMKEEKKERSLEAVCQRAECAAIRLTVGRLDQLSRLCHPRRAHRVGNEVAAEHEMIVVV